MLDSINDKIDFIIKHFSEKELVKTELQYNNDYQLLISVVLSAQCTDKRVNIISQNLFKEYKSFYELANAKEEDVYKIIKSISFPEVKTERIINISKIISERYSNKVPSKFQDLININGIGRKTANLVLAILYDYPGIAVDTHVARVSSRLGLTTSKKPDIIEKDLSQSFPQKYWNKINPWFVILGRYICKAIKPKCDKCMLKNMCIYIKTITVYKSS